MSIGCYYFTIAKATITWQSKRQHTIAKSSMEVKYISLSIETLKGIWLRMLLTKL
uniref:Uncharacterized protein n=1 Tax=Physcomitrium patens TaxID=3218 RepID=A0A2K1IRY2_PHYPA|nr:hypothetical protein PHYPA_026166 [Physcomitrium patens]